MYVVATFEQSTFLELAISELEQTGLTEEQILVAPLDKRREPGQLFDTIYHADGLSMLDLAAILGTVFMLLGAIYGYVLYLGPIIWGIIGAVFGLLLGFIIKYMILRKKNAQGKRGPKTLTSEVVMIIHCHEDKWDIIQHIIWENHALGVTRLNR